VKKKGDLGVHVEAMQKRNGVRIPGVGLSCPAERGAPSPSIPNPLNLNTAKEENRCVCALALSLRAWWAYLPLPAPAPPAAAAAALASALSFMALLSASFFCAGVIRARSPGFGAAGTDFLWAWSGGIG
jgi:hypothetical protein